LPERAAASGTEDPEAQFSQLLQELRVALPGVQVLLAFLLTVPFDQRFEQLGDIDTAAFTVAVAAAALAVVLLIAPSAQHRVAWRSGRTDYVRLLRLANAEALIGLVGVAVSLAASMYVVVDLIYRQPLAAVIGAALAALIAWLWLVVPLRVRRSSR
jgi:hypothetical protein